METGLIIAGVDVVAVDAVTGAVMGFAVEEIGCVREAARMRLGTGDLNEIQVLGEQIGAVQRRFTRAEEAIERVLPLPQGFRLVIDPKACTGCRNQILSSLLDMKEAGVLDRAAGWTVLCGGAEQPDEQAAGAHGALPQLLALPPAVPPGPASLGYRVVRQSLEGLHHGRVVKVHAVPCRHSVEHLLRRRRARDAHVQAPSRL